jgi:hypothetical protein
MAAAGRRKGGCLCWGQPPSPPKLVALHDQHRWLIGVVVSTAHDRQRPRANVNRVPGFQSGTALLSVGGSAGSPSTVSNLNMNPAIRSSLPLGWGRTAARSIVGQTPRHRQTPDWPYA